MSPIGRDPTYRAPFGYRVLLWIEELAYQFPQYPPVFSLIEPTIILQFCTKSQYRRSLPILPGECRDNYPF